MSYDFSDFKKQIISIEDWLKKEFSGLRTGRASITLLDTVFIDAYGSKMPLNQSASLSIEDARTIRISPWDKTLVGPIEKAISLSDLGVSTVSDGEGVRAIFPVLTTENREKLVKVAKNKTEDAKVSVRTDRSTVIKEIETAQKAGELPEDDAKRDKETLQKLVDEANKNLESLFVKKEEEILCQ
ncbi:MAG: ribosome recycling factor [Candidatus Pacebacteria bacterium]|nr:ribosome recycling factor [Candidatus Paceibacterota bacterium]